MVYFSGFGFQKRMVEISQINIKTSSPLKFHPLYSYRIKDSQ